MQRIVAPVFEVSEKCAVFGAYNIPRAAHVAKEALQALQHRGQAASGIASPIKGKLARRGGEGMVAEAYSDGVLNILTGVIAVGHNRYPTSGGGGDGHPQPAIEANGRVAFAHNGNLALTTKLKHFLTIKHVAHTGLNDSELMARTIGTYIAAGETLAQAIALAYPLFTGAFSCVAVTDDSLAAFRDSCGIRPLCVGTLAGGFVIASETCALDAIGATFVRDVDPGEMVLITADGITSYRLAAANPKSDLFELVYFASEHSMYHGQRICDIRGRLGERLAQEQPAKADIVCPVPNSAIPAAEGYAKASGLPYVLGLVRNPKYVKRTFIEPDQDARAAGVRAKLHADPSIVGGKRVVIVDDSIVRGTTTVPTVQMLRDAGATEVHLRISSPSVRYPDFYGTDIPDQTELLASRMSLAQMCEFLGVDSLGFLSLEGTTSATGEPVSNFCTACFNGDYPIPIGENINNIAWHKAIA